MRRLTVNPGTDNAWEIPLTTGIITLGRNEDNDFVINHPSVSGNHCQLLVMDTAVTVKDLGSTSGTFINGQPVEEAALVPGQSIQLGEVLLGYEFIPETAPVAVPVPVISKAICKFHRNNPARFLCPQCQGNFCEMCVNTRHSGGVVKTFCRTCAVECTRLETAPLVVDEEEVSFGTLAKGAFKYPLRGDGLILLVTGTIFFLLVDGASYIVRYALIYGFTALIILTVLSGGYLAAYFWRILASSAMGEDKMPDWPDITDVVSDVVSPFFRFLGLCFVCFCPSIFLTIYAATLTATEDNAWLGWATMALMLFSCVYFPMAFTAVGMYNTLAAVNPLLIIPSITKVLKEYAITILLLVVALIIRRLCLSYLSVIPHFWFFATVLNSFLFLYLTTVEVRLLGLLYRVKKYELGWFT